MKRVPTKYLRETIVDAQIKNGTQHAIDKERLISILEELIQYRELIDLGNGNEKV